MYPEDYISAGKHLKRLMKEDSKTAFKTASPKKLLIIFLLVIRIGLIPCLSNSPSQKSVDVLIVGGGASGTMAGIQSARMGVKTLIAEETPWLGGMLTAAGVSAIDGNDRLPSGLWAEFREKIISYYGGNDSVNTGWVSKVLFEPSTGVKILKEMTKAEQFLEVRTQSTLYALKKINGYWKASFISGNDTLQITATVMIDATELGDVAKMAGVSYDIGMDSRYETAEAIAPEEANDIIQDLTYVVILKDYGKKADMTIPMPANYNPALFYCTCDNDKCQEAETNQKLWDCSHMMQYGRLPGNKYMINWPIYGNDYYVNTIEMTEEERKAAYETAKEHTRCYVYFLQNELGFKNLGIALNEFPSEDGFPLIPYHRESRRIKGKVRFTINDLAKPFQQETALYRTGIAVGDYPVDHHHAAFPDPSKIPEIHFYPIPSYCVPLGSLIPEHVEDLIIAEKSISVSNIVNGTTRLQPVCILVGQASGILAALSVKHKVSPSEISVRMVQEKLIEEKAFIQPYADVTPEMPYWKAVQRIGATGIIKGEGKNEGWANLTLFYPDSLMLSGALSKGIKELIPRFRYNFKETNVSLAEAVDVSIKIHAFLQKSKTNKKDINPSSETFSIEFNNLRPDSYVTRFQMAQILDGLAHPFHLIDIDYSGHTIKN